MSRCERCRYALISGRCPVCAGKQIKGVGPVEKATPNAPSLAPLPIYYTPSAPCR